MSQNHRSTAAGTPPAAVPGSNRRTLMSRLDRLKLARAAVALVAVLALSGCSTAPSKLVGEPSPSQSSTPVEEQPVAPVAAAPKLVLDEALPMAFASTWTPPTFSGTYRIVDAAAGYPETGATYLLMHSCVDPARRCPGTLVAEAAAGMVPGDIIQTADGVRWTLTEQLVVAKGGLQDTDRIWQTSPDSLVITTCEPQGKPSSANLVLLATKEGS